MDSSPAIYRWVVVERGTWRPDVFAAWRRVSSSLRPPPDHHVISRIAMRKDVDNRGVGSCEAEEYLCSKNGS